MVEALEGVRRPVDCFCGRNLVVALPYDDNDLQSLALCIWKEARGDGMEGMRAVAHVVANRVVEWYGSGEGSVHNAVYAKNQFTSMSVPSDAQFNLEPEDGNVLYRGALAICGTVLDGTDDDLTNGALYYANLQNASSDWFDENIVRDPTHHPQTAVIGHQTFFA
jgi:N-acetylmuramoyl-L-alanine amidase